MKKLNEEKLISAFYDFGEVYWIREADERKIIYTDPVLEAQGQSIDMIYNYIDEHDIGCTIEKVYHQDGNGYYYKLKSDDDDLLKEFLAAVDIYEGTSIVIYPLNILEGSVGSYLYGKNAIEELWSTGDANGDDKITIKDCLFIAKKLAKREGAKLPDSADYNKDGKKNIKDAAAIAIDIAKRNIK